MSHHTVEKRYDSEKEIESCKNKSFDKQLSRSGAVKKGAGEESREGLYMLRGWFC
jgi:hypothetical protein